MSKVEEPVIFVCNHQTLWDHVFCYLFEKNTPHTMMKGAIRYYPLVGFTVRMIDSLFVYSRKPGTPDQQKDPRNAEAMRKAENLLRQGVSLQIFPEGTRRWKQRSEYANINTETAATAAAETTTTGSPANAEHLQQMKEQAMDDDPASIGPFRAGAFKLAIDTGVKMVPLLMEMRHLINDEQMTAQPGTMRLHILEPVDPKQFNDVDSLANHVHDIMQKEFRKVVSDIDAPLLIPSAHKQA